MKLKYVTGLTGLLCAAVLLGGCAKEAELESNGIYIRKDGSVSSAVYEPFDADVYSKEELKAFVEDAVIAYNQSEGADAAAYMDKKTGSLLAAIRSLETADGNAVLKMEYATCKDYLQFNDADESIIQLASGTVGGAEQAGIDLKQFTLVNRDGSEQITADEAEDDLYVVFAEGNTQILVEGTIEYVSSDVELVDRHLAEIASEEGRLSCIVFK